MPSRESQHIHLNPFSCQESIFGQRFPHSMSSGCSSVDAGPSGSDSRWLGSAQVKSLEIKTPLVKRKLQKRPSGSFCSVPSKPHVPFSAPMMIQRKNEGKLLSWDPWGGRHGEIVLFLNNDCSSSSKIAVANNAGHKILWYKDLVGSTDTQLVELS